MSKELVSVVIPFYKGKQWLEEALTSLVSQTYKNLEVVIINDGSDENIQTIIDNFRTFFKITYLEIPQNRGPGFARNVGIENSKGEYIAFLDSDDIWLPNKIYEQLNFMKKNNLCWSHTAYEVFSSNGRRRIRKPKLMKGYVFQSIFYSCPIATPTVMIKSAVFRENLEFRFPEIYTGEDTLLWILLSTKYKLGYIDKVLCKVRSKPENASKDIHRQIYFRGKLLEYIEQVFASVNKKIPIPAKFVLILYKTIYQLLKINKKRNKLFKLFLTIWYQFLRFFSKCLYVISGFTNFLSDKSSGDSCA